MTGGGSALPPWDDYWYSRPGWDSAAGMAVTPETAMRLAAVFACIRVRSETLATCPLVLFRRLPNGGKERAREHPLYKVLHDSPNQWQTSFEWIEMMQAHLDLRGNAFSRILPGPRGAIDQLIPLHPDLVQVYRLPNGKLKYQVRSRFEGEVKWYMQEEILHLRGLSSDGLVGLSPIALQRETMGKGLGMQDYGARFFANDASTSTWIKHPGRFKTDAARAEFKKNWQKSQTGENRMRTAVLEDGLELKQMGLSNKDSQFLEATSANAIEICGMYLVPPHKIGMLDRATHSNIEHQGIEFKTGCMQGIATRWERRLNSDLVEPVSEALGDDEYFAEFLLDSLERGDMKTRFEAYAIARNWGFLNPNRICEREGWDPIPEEKGGEEYLRPLNMVPAGTVYVPAMASDAPDPMDKPAPGEDQRNDPAPPPDTPDDVGQDASQPHRQLLKAFATEAARRVVRKEVTALRKTLKRFPIDPTGFAKEAQAFYTSHVSMVAQTTCISAEEARRYAESNLKLIVSVEDPEEKSCVLDWIEDTAPDALAELAVEGKSASLALRS
jgi:HK97 family phage portal protein